MSTYIKKKKALPTQLDIIEPDWDILVMRLIQAGYRKASIARFCDCSRETVASILNGRAAHVGWYTGQRILQLHRSIAK